MVLLRGIKTGTARGWLAPSLSIQTQVKANNSTFQSYGREIYRLSYNCGGNDDCLYFKLVGTSIIIAGENLQSIGAVALGQGAQLTNAFENHTHFT